MRMSGPGGRRAGKTLSIVQFGDHVGDQGAPAGLVRGAEPAAGVAVVVFVEQDVVLEMRIGLHLLVTAEDGAASLVVAPEDVDEASAQFVGNLLQRCLAAGADRTFDPKLVAVEIVVLVEALDE